MAMFVSDLRTNAGAPRWFFLRDVLLPVRCGVCGALGSSPCRRCAALFEPCVLPPAVPIGVTSITAPFSFEGSVRQLVTSLKYRGNRGAVRFLAGHMAAALSPSVVGRCQSVTWAPTSVSRRRVRGFDQAELLAQEVAVLLGVPCNRLLLHSSPRRGAGHPSAQTGLSRRDRATRADEELFRSASGFRHQLGSVLLVDDVLTTGATLRAASSVLRHAGAHSVHGVVAAATPRHFA
jgi:competence protein ComFC